MIDVITYTDKPVKDKLLSDYPDKINVLEDGSIKLKVAKIQTERTDNHAVSLIRCEEEDLEWLGDVFEVLATGRCREGFWSEGEYHSNDPFDHLTPEGEKKYFLAYNRVYKDDEGVEQLRPYVFGRFQ